MSPFTFNHFPSVHLFQHEDEVSGVDPIILGKPELSTSEKVCRCISSATTKPKHCTRYANIPVAGTPFEHPCFPAKCTALCKFSWGAKGWWHATGGRLPAGGATSNQSGGRGRGQEGKRARFPEALVDGWKWGKVTRGTRAGDEWEFVPRAPTL